jgi:hypothetical protein
LQASLKAGPCAGKEAKMKKAAGKLQLHRETVHHLAGDAPGLRDAAAGNPPALTVPVSCLACFAQSNPLTACKCNS